MKKHTLQGVKRDAAAGKVSQLRREGRVPATVYGKNVNSESFSVSLPDFVKVYGEAHETGLIELTVDGVVKPVLVHAVQVDPVKSTVLHVEFHQVDLKEKVHADVPLVLIGESPAVAQKTGVILSLVSELEVEALPTDLPEKLEADISGLSEIDQELTVANIPVPHGVTILSDAAIVIAKVAPMVSKEAEEQAAAEAAAVAAPAEGEEAASAATPAEQTAAEAESK